jgi:hypothetical protein
MTRLLTTAILSALFTACMLLGGGMVMEGVKSSVAAPVQTDQRMQTALCLLTFRQAQ